MNRLGGPEVNLEPGHEDDPRRGFALRVVQTLRAEGFAALWAGGCVRDALLGKRPKDYDVASTAAPADVIRIFGVHRTVPVGASFGVVIVLAPGESGGQVEVATFRNDGEYLDGRRPSSVRYCEPEEDAKRRDFTINGIFFDPISNTIIDYVGGQDDLQRKVVRAIGDPEARFREDKLRMLRAVRFAATFSFQLDRETGEAIRKHCRELNQVSVERIAQELRRMLAHPSAHVSLQLLAETDLLAEALPEITSEDRQLRTPHVAAVIRGLQEPSFESALAALLLPLRNDSGASRRERLASVVSVCRRLKLSNEETEGIGWIADSVSLVTGIRQRPLHILKPLLADVRAPQLLDVATAIAQSEERSAEDAEFCRAYLKSHTPEVLSPDFLVTGDDLLKNGIPPGRLIRDILATIRNEQLDEVLNSREQALLRMRQLAEDAVKSGR